jgi:hypothetical protein
MVSARRNQNRPQQINAENHIPPRNKNERVIQYFIKPLNLAKMPSHFYPETSLINVISEGEPTRTGGPQ